MIEHTLKQGDTLQNGKYEILSILGQGGFGITYLANYPLMDKKVAIKELFISGYCVRNTYDSHVTLQSMPREDYTKFKQRFIEEAKTLHNLRNPHLVWVQDMFEENETVYFVMDYVPGTSLREVLKQKGRLPESESLNFILQIAKALKTVHSKNLLHRDIKPDNIIITPENKAVLIDFGNARTFSDGKTVVHSTFITPGFAPPEQYYTKEHRGFYMDIYSLGATLYACLSGKTPTASIERQFDNEPLENLNEFSSKTRQLIEKSMALKPIDRYQTVEEFMSVLVVDEKEENSALENKTKIVTNSTLKETPEFLQNSFFFKIPELVFVKGGSFLMGSEIAKDEKPIHKVTVSDFFIGKYPVTNEEFADFINDYGSDEIKEGFYKEKKIILEHNWGLKKKNGICKLHRAVISSRL